MQTIIVTVIIVTIIVTIIGTAITLLCPANRAQDTMQTAPMMSRMFLIIVSKIYLSSNSKVRILYKLASLVAKKMDCCLGIGGQGAPPDNFKRLTNLGETLNNRSKEASYQADCVQACANRREVGFVHIVPNRSQDRSAAIIPWWSLPMQRYCGAAHMGSWCKGRRPPWPR